MREDKLNALGKKTKYSMDYAPEVLETFINKHQENNYFVKFNCPEFTSLCPITGQPDFATIYISYIPDVKMVESKSLKLYLFSFRNHGDFHEDCVNIIMKDLIKLMEPRYIEVWGKFTPRGGISIDPYCNYGKPGTIFEEMAKNRLMWHDMNPEKVDNRIKYKKIIRISTKADYLQHLNNLKDAGRAVQRCNYFVNKNNLNMNIMDAFYTFDRSQLIFRFIADDRVDFRQLAKDLGSAFKTRIELRQIGIRDKAREIGGIGPCGRKLCCTTFLTDFDSVSINMAKNQSLALNPSKINGSCGRLLCCLKYEDDNYLDYKKGLPDVGSTVTTEAGKGKVVSVNLFKRKYNVFIEGNGIVTVEVE